MVYPISAFGNQPSQPGVGLESNKSALTKVALGAGAITAGGFISTSKGRLWDKYVSGIRAIESGSPGGVLKTFRLSEFLSPLESYSTINLPEDTFFGGKYAEFLRASFGEVKELSFKRTGTIFGEATDEAGKVVGYGLQIKAGTQKSTAIADYAARIRGLIISENQSLNDSLLRTEYRRLKPSESYNEWLRMMEPELRQRRLIIGAKLRNKVNVLGKDLQLSEAMSRRFAKLEAGSLLLRAKAASTAGRLNTLLTAPFDLPIVKDIAKRVPFFRTMAVQPGSNLEIMARLTKKGIYAGLAWKGLEYADYLRSEGSPLAPVALTGLGMGFGNLLARRPGMMFSKAGLLVGGLFGAAASVAPRFDEGLFYGAATLGTDASLARASFSQSIGLTESLQRQNEITPGLMNPGTLLAAGGIASLATGMWTYGGMIKKALINKEAGRSVANAIDAAREIARSEGLEKLWKSSIGSKIAKTPLLKNLTKIKSPMTLGFFAGAAAMGVAASTLALASGNIMAAMPFAGVLGTTETPEELQQIYSGEKEVAVRKGRFWEMGRGSPYAGGRIEYYRQHMLPRLKSRAYEKGLYGSEEERWAHDPLLHPLKALFGDDEWKYWYEQKYQKERPAPITGTYGEDIPFIGPLIAATVGKLFKPRKLIRPEEWATESGFVHRPDVRGEQEPAYHLGGLAPGAPVAPDEPTQLLNELNYRRREAVGLVGFAEGSLTKALIGREEFLPNKETLAAMGKETGSEYWLWKHLNLGGAAALSEPVRRFIPRTRSYLETYNPLENQMPSWLPDDYFIDLKYGNPFEKISEAELRLPGAGMAALYPELEGVNPEDYPLAYRLKVLGDVAMYSDEYRKTLSFAKKHIENMSSQHAKIVLDTERQVREKKKRTELEEYRFRSEELSREQVTISDVISPSRFKTKEYGDLIVEAQGIQRVEDKEAAMNMAKDLVGQKISLYTPAMESRKFSSISGAARVKAVPIINGDTWASLLESEGAITRKPYKDEFEQLEYSTMERLVGGASEKLLHGLETPLEFLTPLSPASKLISQRSAIEEYAASRAHGTLNAFWDRPVENFISPAISMTAHKMGATSIPKNIQEKRDIQEYYDMLKWVKSSRLESLARQKGDLSEAAEFKRQKESTVFGMDVFKSPVNIIKALPRNERDFFGAFSAAKTEEDRQKILDMVPENEKRIYLSQWLRQEESAAYAKRKAKLDTEEDNNIINLASLARKSEGFGFGDVEQEQWLQETGGRIAFDDYLRERKAEEYFSTHSLPDPEWLGWSPAVDLDDVKMVNAEMAGCISGDSYILDNNLNQIKAESIIEKDILLDFKGKGSKVNKIFKYQNNKEVYKLSNSGIKFKSIYITENHKVPIIRQSCYNYKRLEVSVKDIHYKDYIMYPKLVFEEELQEIDLLNYTNNKRRTYLSKDKKTFKLQRNGNSYKRHISLDKDFGNFLGWYIAEGNFVRHKNKLRAINFSLALDELDVANWIIQYTKDTFGCNTTIFQEKNAKAYRLTIHSVVVANLIKSFCCGHKATTKKLTSMFYQLPRKVISSALRSWYYGDGWNDCRLDKEGNPKMLSIGTSSYELAYQGWYLLNSLGIRTKLQKVRSRKKKLKPYQLVYGCNISDSYRLNIGTNIAKKAFLNLTTNKEQDYLKKVKLPSELNGFFWFMIKLEKLGKIKMPVYDFNVKDPHYYTTICGIIHNSDYHDLDLWDQRKRSLARKPYINPELVEDMQANAEYEDAWKVARNSKTLAKMYDDNNAEVQILQMGANVGEDKYNITIMDDRKELVEKAYKQLGM